eukprot:3298901-Prymnesium_polylepis.1
MYLVPEAPQSRVALEYRLSAHHRPRARGPRVQTPQDSELAPDSRGRQGHRKVFGSLSCADGRAAAALR